MQHVRLLDPLVIERLTQVFEGLHPLEHLYPGSPAHFRSRWDRVLAALGVPATAGFTPGSIRGGGAVAAYNALVPMTDILWQMRLRSITTLEHYIQEVAALGALADLPPDTKDRIRLCSRCLPLVAPAAARSGDKR